MKTFLIRRRALSLAACAAAVCLMFYVINYPAAVDASASQRQLPIYCVQRDQKLASVSFDAACGWRMNAVHFRKYVSTSVGRRNGDGDDRALSHAPEWRRL